MLPLVPKLIPTEHRPIVPGVPGAPPPALFSAKSFFPSVQPASSSGAVSPHWLRPSQTVSQPQHRPPDLAFPMQIPTKLALQVALSFLLRGKKK